MAFIMKIVLRNDELAPVFRYISGIENDRCVNCSANPSSEESRQQKHQHGLSENDHSPVSLEAIGKKQKIPRKPITCLQRTENQLKAFQPMFHPTTRMKL